MKLKDNYQAKFIAKISDENEEITSKKIELTVSPLHYNNELHYLMLF